VDRYENLRRRRVDAGLILNAAEAGLHRSDHIWHGPQPVNDVIGTDALTQMVLQPVSNSLQQIEQRLDILIAGGFNGHDWTASCGHYVGEWAEPLFGIKPNEGQAQLRFGRFERWDGDQIAETYEIFDLPGMMMQSGVWPGWPGLGKQLDSPPPATRDGVVMEPGDAEETEKSRQLTEDMIADLLSYDGQNFSSMKMLDHWASDMKWYGPAGIGAMHGYEDYKRGHGLPFLGAFPDREGAFHKSRIAERSYVASTGWPSVQATHSGDTFMGVAATNNRVGMRVMDFWRRDGDRLAENWVYIDIIDLLQQMGVDIFAQMRALDGKFE